MSTGGAIERVLAAGAGPTKVPSYLDAVKVSLIGLDEEDWGRPRGRPAGVLTCLCLRARAHMLARTTITVGLVW